MRRVPWSGQGTREWAEWDARPLRALPSSRRLLEKRCIFRVQEPASEGVELEHAQSKRRGYVRSGSFRLHLSITGTGTPCSECQSDLFQRTSARHLLRRGNECRCWLLRSSTNLEDNGLRVPHICRHKLHNGREFHILPFDTHRRGWRLRVRIR